MSLWPIQPPEFSRLPLPDRLLVPLSARMGGEAKVLRAGTAVRKGHALVVRPAESSHVALAPADGVLENVRPIRLSNGRPTLAIELVVDHTAAGEIFKDEPKDLRQADPSALLTWIERIRRAGIWADRNASPDLIGQLNQAVSRPIDTVVCTALDSDAGMRLNGSLVARFGNDVAEGTALLARITRASRSILAVEAEAHPAWAVPWWEAGRAAKLEVVELANDYPQADPTLMVYSLTNRRLRPGNLPTTQGVLVVDAAAAWAIGQTARGLAMLSSPLAVHDHLRRRSHYLDVAVGTPLQYVLEKISGWEEGFVVRGGDLLRDLRLRIDAVIGGGELTIHLTGPEVDVIPEPCIRCAWCMEACPTLVYPASVLEGAQRRELRLAQRAGLEACIECGVCAHVCPSRLPILDAIRDIRNQRSTSSRSGPVEGKSE
ncbi:MAG: 4Fe-4S dicluster domain-containing protein [Tepidisphaeraceae bacterium]|jgi:electron transport complex protein RnfC